VKFAYEAVPVKGTQPPHWTGRRLLAYRPLVPIRIHGPLGFRDLQGLVDTGSEFTLFPIQWAGFIGVVTAGGGLPLDGLGAGKLLAHFAQVTLELRKKRRGAWATHVWRAWVGFSADLRVVLGQDGFLQYFTATFACKAGPQHQPFQQHVTLQPNTIFATVQVPPP
jgi:hypothetical protein